MSARRDHATAPASGATESANSAAAAATRRGSRGAPRSASAIAATNQNPPTRKWKYVAATNSGVAAASRSGTSTDRNPASASA